MKQILALVICLFLAYSMNAKERIVNQPPFVAWSSTILEIESITLNDTATILNISANDQSGWWFQIVSDTYLLADGVKYPLKSSEGFELDKPITMPESGTMSFRLIFPALPQTIKEIDFFEGNDERSFRIWGIRLDGQPIKNSLAGKTNSKKEFVLETPVIKAGNATFSGHIAGYTPQMNFKTTLMTSNLLLGGTEEFPLHVNEDGTFSVNIPTPYIRAVSIYSSFMNSLFFIKPGETTFVEINLAEFSREESRIHHSSPSLGDKYFFSGALADLNNSLANSSIKELPIGFSSQEEYQEMLKAASDMTPEQYKAYWIERFENSIKALDKHPELTNSMRDFLIMNAKLDLALECIAAGGILTDACKQKHNIEKETLLPDSLKPVFTKEYYDFLPKLIPTNSSILYLNKSHFCLSDLSDIILDGIPLLPNDKDAKETLFAELMGSSAADFLYKLINARNLAAPIKNFTPLTDNQLAYIGKISPEIQKYFTLLNEDLKQTIEDNKKKTDYIVNPVDTKGIPNEDLFAAITQPYRGKVVFVDFWATWCGPCLSAMKVAEPVKEEFSDKDVIFLYLAAEDSPFGTWQQKIREIKGEHYRVTQDQWRYWSKKFKIEGIPSYMVIGKDGNPVHFQIGFMGAEKMKELLSTELVK